jgi:hypothetical protein
VFTKSIKKCSDIYTEIKSYSIGQIFLIHAKFSLYLSIMWICLCGASLLQTHAVYMSDPIVRGRYTYVGRYKPRINLIQKQATHCYIIRHGASFTISRKWRPPQKRKNN